MSDQRRGAARSETARLAVLDATARLFADRGYDHLTIEGIAAEAGVAKQTIYRWWSAKSALVAECLLEGRLLPHRLLVPDTGDLRADLAAWLREVFALIRDAGGQSLFSSLVAAATENVEVGRRLRDSLSADDSLTGRLSAAIAAGQLDAGTPLLETSEALVGAVMLRALGRTHVDDDDALPLVVAVLGPRLR